MFFKFRGRKTQKKREIKKEKKDGREEGRHLSLLCLCHQHNVCFNFEINVYLPLK